MAELDQALARAGQIWTPDISNVDAEQAYSDRLTLAGEVTRLRDEIVEMEQELREADREIENLARQIDFNVK